MKITGIGVDIESISRFRKKPIKENLSFYTAIFTEKEISYCLNKKDPYPHFTARFCAKEAFIKAVNKEVKDYTLIEILQMDNKPTIKWKQSNVFLSMAHEKNKALAFVIISNKGV